ncbi:MAG TPA: rhodanese-like domain-containing protein [Steroidobacteraceae bacterium]|nr:rhodanese-like domain-containing protein [Steroidobacteraceae bacterium]
MIEEITPPVLKARLDGPDAPLVLDVREPWERDLARLPATLDIPMNEIPRRLAELPRDRDIVVMCLAGGRSRRVAEYLAAQGFTRLANLTGGIRGWSEQVDPDVPVY